ncbi:hypothetical protein SAMN06265337_3336 [Hymenobacter gelipurpurascens]|uniref:Uncharacterized protein n=1 Tax=Hymenobacter gelipurpurascens TaxID=89968 RepID=A0A212UDM0_9BACT|nr:hypothetical protein SAMN06265337_3336 [Hymenobacter gelipurpurascens]
MKSGLCKLAQVLAAQRTNSPASSDKDTPPKSRRRNRAESSAFSTQS